MESSMEMSKKLYEAAEEGDIKFLKEIEDADLQKATPLGNTALHVAATSGRTQFFREVWRRCNNNNLLIKANSKGDTPLHCAARNVYVEIVKIIIENAQSMPGTSTGDLENGGVGILFATNNAGNTALHEAVENICWGSSTALHLLEANSELACLVNNVGESSLHIAARHGHQEAVEKILKTSPSINCVGPGGQTPLHAAVEMVHTDVVKVLLKRKPELLEVPDSKGRNALHIAAWKGWPGMVGILLEKNTSLAYMLDSKGFSPLHIAAFYGYVDVVSKLLKKCCPDVVKQVLPSDGRNALHIATIRDHAATVKCLLKFRVVKKIINELDKNGDTALHLAVKFNSISSLKKLLENKSMSMFIRNKDGYSAIDITYFDPKRMIDPNKLKIRDVLSRHGAIARWRPEEAISNDVEHLKNLASSWTLVATLIATVTFAAAFTVPGGYRSESPNMGSAILAKRAAFIVFLISNSISMCSAITVVVWLSRPWLMLIQYKDRTLKWAHKLIWVACIRLIVSLMTGVYAVVGAENQWVAILVCVICCMTFCFQFAKSDTVYIVRNLWVTEFWVLKYGGSRRFVNRVFDALRWSS